MKRDARRGSEQWSGCHRFENIICDGRAGRISNPRHGGLRMGGTYWYYFQLDNDIEHYNPAEPSTTNCPLLPGQPVNVLEVPIQFSGRRRRHRSGSISSTSSERRTMDPNDKFVNPRPAPGPSSPRCDISVPFESRRSLPQSSRVGTRPSQSSHERNVSLPGGHPISSTSLARKGSIDGGGRRKRSGLKATLRHLTSGKGAEQEKSDRGRSSLPSVPSLRKSRSPLSDISSRAVSAPNSRPPSRRGPTPPSESSSGVDTGLALRRALESMAKDDRLPSSSFQHHRRQRSRSREPSPLRGPSTSTETSKNDAQPKEANVLQYHPMEPLQEVLSPQKETKLKNAVTEPPVQDAVSASIPQLLQKELPTIPISPLAAHPIHESTISSPTEEEFPTITTMMVSPEVPLGSLAKLLSRDRAAQNGHRRVNSASTLSSSQWSSRLLDMKSPPLSQATSRSSYPTSPYEIPQFPHTPKSAMFKRRSTPIFDHRMPSIISSSTISSYDTYPSSPASEASEPRADRHVPPSSLQKRYGMLLAPQQNYKLPEEAVASQSFKWDGQGLNHAGDDPSSPSHTTNIHQILHDLSYLGNAIQD